MHENQLFMMENPFYYPQMTPNEYEKIIQALANRDDDILNRVMYGDLELKPRRERTREYIFEILGIS